MAVASGAFANDFVRVSVVAAVLLLAALAGMRVARRRQASGVLGLVVLLVAIAALAMAAPEEGKKQEAKPPAPCAAAKRLLALGRLDKAEEAFAAEPAPKDSTKDDCGKDGLERVRTAWCERALLLAQAQRPNEAAAALVRAGPDRSTTCTDARIALAGRPAEPAAQATVVAPEVTATAGSAEAAADKAGDAASGKDHFSDKVHAGASRVLGAVLGWVRDGHLRSGTVEVGTWELVAALILLLAASRVVVRLLRWCRVGPVRIDPPENASVDDKLKPAGIAVLMRERLAGKGVRPPPSAPSGTLGTELQALVEKSPLPHAGFVSRLLAFLAVLWRVPEGFQVSCTLVTGEEAGSCGVVVQVADAGTTEVVDVRSFYASTHRRAAEKAADWVHALLLADSVCLAYDTRFDGQAEALTLFHDGIALERKAEEAARAQ